MCLCIEILQSDFFGYYKNILFSDHCNISFKNITNKALADKVMHIQLQVTTYSKQIFIFTY